MLTLEFAFAAVTAGDRAHQRGEVSRPLGRRPAAATGCDRGGVDRPR
jgi:hypothetical protein